LAIIVTVAVETPPESVEDPTVQRAVVDDEKLTTPPDEVLPVIAKVWVLDEVTRSLNEEKAILLACPTSTSGSMYICAPKA
jgi:hypothetical protein